MIFLFVHFLILFFYAIASIGATDRAR